MKHLDREVRQKYSAVRRVVFSTLSVSVSSVDLRLMFDIYIYIYTAVCKNFELPRYMNIYWRDLLIW